MNIFKRGDFVTPVKSIYVNGIGTCYPGDIFVVAAANRVDDTITINGDASDDLTRDSILGADNFTRANREFMSGDVLTCMVGGYAGLSGGCLYTAVHSYNPDGDILHLTVSSNRSEFPTLKCAATRFFYRKSNNPDNINDRVGAEVDDAITESAELGPVMLVETSSIHTDGCFPRSITTQTVEAAVLEELYAKQGAVPAAGNHMVFQYRNPDHTSYEMRTYTSTESLYWMVTTKLKKSNGKITGGDLLHVDLVRNAQPLHIEYDEKGDVITTEYIPFEGSV